MFDVLVGVIRLKVAPHWGAWIEILPVRMNGYPVDSRTPLGCVD